MTKVTTGNWAAVSGFRIDYGGTLETEIAALQAQIKNAPAIAGQFPSRWLAIKLLEGDEVIRPRIQALPDGLALIAAADKSISRVERYLAEEIEIVMAERRYTWINQAVVESVTRPDNLKLTLTDRIDKVLTHRWLGLPFFLFAMWAVFKLTADVSAPFLDWVNGVISGPLTHWAAAVFAALGREGTWVESLFGEGILAGVGSVLVFVPVLTSLYIALAVLEESGYMARAAFVMDRLMRIIGLHGKSFLPMMVGFGCSVPAIYATRTLEKEKDRILTGLLVPFMSCGARLPVYVLFASIFFPHSSGLVVFSMYLIGILTAIILGLVLKRTLFRGKENSHFVLELPPYRLPSIRNVLRYTWERTGAFIHGASTLILGTSLVLWLLLAIPTGGEAFATVDVRDSAFAVLSRQAAPAFEPLGFGEWEASGSLITGFIAKEVVVATMGQVYESEPLEAAGRPATFREDLGFIGSSFLQASVDTIKSIPLIVGIDLFGEQEQTDLTMLMASIRNKFEASSGGHGALAAFAFMVFVLLYTPCVVSVAAAKQELGTKWMWVSVAGQFILAWLAAFIVFQGGLLLGVG